MATEMKTTQTEKNLGTEPKGKGRSTSIEIKHDRIIYAPPSTGLSFRDPAEFLDFARPIADSTIRFDSRTNDELGKAAFSETTAMQRERALWELADRQGAEALSTIRQFIDAEPDRAARRHALWLLQRSAGDAGATVLSNYFGDSDPEVADWSRTLAEELTGEQIAPIYRKVVVHENRAFDQTLPLVISGYALVNIPSVGRIVATLSPLWFDSILGRVMACTNTSTFMTDLVIEKCLLGLHPDNSPHYELFKFKGFSSPLSDRVFEHHYESLTMRRFYPSGTVEEGDPIMIPVPLSRIAGTETAAPNTASPTGYFIEGDGERAERMRSAGFVRTVRGRYFGWAAINLSHVLATGNVVAGDVQLSNPTDPVAGPMTNTRLYGTFRGKISDLNDDGHLDLNTIECHGTVDGELDLHCDGSKVDDPYAV